MADRKRSARRGSFRLNGRGWVFLALTASVAFAAALKGNNLLFAIFCLLLAQLVVSGILTVVVARGIVLSRLLPPSATAGGLFTVGIRLRNDKRFWPAFCLRIEDRVTTSGRLAPLPPTPVWIPLAGPRKRIRTASYATAPERGWARLGPFSVVSEFPPGLFTYRRAVPVVNRLLIYPRMGLLRRRYLDPVLARGTSGRPSASEFDPGHEEFAGLREFRPGDSPKAIHWKMSARLPGRLLVREFDDPRVREATILLETHLPRPQDSRRRARLERAISFAATLADTLLSGGFHVRFRAFAPEPLSMPLDPRGHDLEELLRTLAVLRPSRTGTLADLVALEEAPEDNVLFLLRLGDDPPSRAPGLESAVILGPAEMRAWMEDLPGDGEEAPGELP